jgi:uncharacterized protein YjbJ (UPF0337 family)
MSEHDKADEARKGLVDSVKGKAKEVIGAVIGNDSLTAEGQLEQTQAHQRKEANSAEAVAEAEAEEARADAAETKVEAAQQRLAASAQAAAAEDSIEAQQAAQKRAAEQAAQQSAVRESVRAEVNAQREAQQAKAEEREEKHDATAEVVDAAAEHQSSVQVAANEKLEAERLRRHADGVANEADLP